MRDLQKAAGRCHPLRQWVTLLRAECRTVPELSRYLSRGTARQRSPAPRRHEHPKHITTFIKHQSPAWVSCLCSASRKPFPKFPPSTAGNLLRISTPDLLTANVIAVRFSKLPSSLKSSAAKQVFGVHHSSSQ